MFTCGWADPLQAWSATRLNPGDPFLHSPALLLNEPGHLPRDVSADGRFLVLSNNATSTCTVVQTDGKKVVTIRQSHVLACALAADGSWLATGSYSQPGLRVWSLPSGHAIADLCSGETIPQALLLGPERLLARSSAGLRVFNTSNWSEHPKPLEGIALRSLASTRDGKFLAALGSQDLRIFETTGFSESLRPTPPRHAGWLGDCHLCFDARGDTLFVQTALATVMKWDLRSIHRELDALGMNPR